MKEALLELESVLRKSPLIVFLPLALLNALIFLYISPVAFYPDEDVHFAYAEHLARTGKAPKVTDKVTQREGLLKFDFSGSNLHIGGVEGFSEETFIAPLPEGREMPTPSTQRAAAYPSTYYRIGAMAANLFVGDESIGGANIFSRFSFYRLYSLILWVLTLWAAAHVMREVFPRNVVYQATGLAMLAFHPRFTAMGVSIGSDIMGVLVMTLVTWRCLLLIKSATWRTPNTLLVLILSVAAVGVKPQAVFAIPMFIAAFGLQQYSHPNDRISTGRILGVAFAGFLLFVAIGLWYTSNFSHDQGGPILDMAHTDGGALSLISFILSGFSNVFVFPVFIFPEFGKSFSLFFSYWAYYRPGMEARYIVPDFAFLFTLKIIVLAAMGGWAFKLLRRRMEPVECFVLFVTIGWWVWIYASTWVLFERETHLQGRYFLQVISAAMPSIIIGLSAFPKKAVRYVVPMIALLFMIYTQYEALKLLTVLYR